MSQLPWIKYSDRMVGRGHPTLGDTLNTPLRLALTSSGYNPDATTFPGFLGPIINAKAFGAVGDDLTNDYAALQAALDNIASSQDVGGIRSLYIPPGRFLTDRPLWIKASGTVVTGCRQGINTQFIGKEAGASSIKCTHQGGPTLFVGDGSATFPNLTTALVPGTGNAWNLNQSTRYLNLRDLPTCDLNGLSQFCVEYFLKTTDVSNSIFAASSGSIWLPHDSQTRAFILYVTTGKLAGLLTTNSGTTSLTPATSVADNLVHHVALTYDGSTVRLFLDGTQLTSGARTGNLSQGITEEVLVGPVNLVAQGAPEQSVGTVATDTTIDSVRLSNTARYVSNFTAPNAKLSSDSNTLALLNLDDFIGPMARVQTKNGDAWPVLRDTNVSTSVYGMGLYGLRLDSATGGAGTHMYLHDNTEFWSVRDCHFQNYRTAICGLQGNKFQWLIDRCAFHPSDGLSRYGVALGAFGGLGHMDTCWFWSGPVPIALGNSAVALTNIFIQAGSDSQVGFCLMEDNIHSNVPDLRNCQFNTESGTPTTFRAALLVGGGNANNSRGARLNSCTLETAQNAPFAILDGVDQVSFNECLFAISGTPASIVQVATNSQVNRPIQFNNCSQVGGGFLPWSNIAGTGAVGKIGKGVAIAFSATPTFDASLRDEFEMATLTANVTGATFTNLTPGQHLSLWVKQDGTGGRTFNTPTNVKGMTAIDTVANHWTQWVFEVGLDLNLYQTGFNSGA